MPLPIPIGWVNDAPVPVVEIVSVGAEETTDVSVVGKFPTAVPFGFTPGLWPAGGALVVDDETTPESSVGNRAEAALDDAEGDGEAAAIGDGSGDSEETLFGGFNRLMFVC